MYVNREIFQAIPQKCFMTEEDCFHLNSPLLPLKNLITEHSSELKGNKTLRTYSFRLAFSDNNSEQRLDQSGCDELHLFEKTIHLLLYPNQLHVRIGLKPVKLCSLLVQKQHGPLPLSDRSVAYLLCTRSPGC